MKNADIFDARSRLMEPRARAATAQTAAASGPPAAARSSDVQESEAMLMGLLGQRRQLVSEIERLQTRRSELVAQAQSGGDAARAKAIAGEAASVERQISDAEVALRAVNRAIAAREGAPKVASATERVLGTTIQPQLLPVLAGSRVDQSDDRLLFFGAGTMLLVALTVTVGVAYARRLRRETADALKNLRSDFWDEMKKLTHGMESIAVEVERIGEGQRYVTKAISEGKSPVEVRPRLDGS